MPTETACLWSASDSETSSLLFWSSVTFCHFPGYFHLCSKEYIFFKSFGCQFFRQNWKRAQNTHSALQSQAERFASTACGGRRGQDGEGGQGKGSRTLVLQGAEVLRCQSSLSKRVRVAFQTVCGSTLVICTSSQQGSSVSSWDALPHLQRSPGAVCF